MIDDVITVDDD